MGRPTTGVLEKAFAVINMLQNREYVTAYTVAQELQVARSTAHKYLTAASLVLPVYVRNEETKEYHEHQQFALLKERGDQWS